MEMEQIRDEGRRTPVKPKEIDPYAALNMVRNADGSVTRLPLFPIYPPVGEEEGGPAGPRCFSKDVAVSRRDDGYAVRYRIYRPNWVSAEERLPVLIFFHGGGFVCFSPATSVYHVNAEEMACGVPALVISVDYRLAPEHRLPAAYDDAVAALKLVRDGSEPWVHDYGDVSRCFLIGSSAGGNIVYRTALRARKIDLGPVKIEGLILVQPFFGGVRRTDSEVRLAGNVVLPLPVTDLMWELSLPPGSDRDHEFCNPATATPAAEELGMLPRSLVTGYLGDLLIDGQVTFARMLKEKGVKVVTQFKEGGHHAAELLDAKALEDFVRDVKSFVSNITPLVVNDFDPILLASSYAAVNMVRNADGSVTRLPLFPTCPPVREEEGDPTGPRCFSKDVVVSRLDDGYPVRYRIYRPNWVSAPRTKLPVLIFFHGGGFIRCSAATEGYHANSEEMACRVPAIVVSVDYRLAPESPLPAAYDDAVAAVEWVRDESSREEPWVRDYGDLSRCFLIGSSAGGNIVYHAALRAMKIDLGLVEIRGLIFVQPFFGGVRRTESELRLADDLILPLPVTDLMWEMCLPPGSDRDHEFCNPMTGTSPAEEEAVTGKLPRSLVSGYLGDPLVDRQRAFARMLEEKGVKVVTQFREGGRHGAELRGGEPMRTLAMDIKSFVHSA